jgi:hypothetical protein
MFIIKDVEERESSLIIFPAALELALVISNEGCWSASLYSPLLLLHSETPVARLLVIDFEARTGERRPPKNIISSDEYGICCVGNHRDLSQLSLSSLPSSLPPSPPLLRVHSLTPFHRRVGRGGRDGWGEQGTQPATSPQIESPCICMFVLEVPSYQAVRSILLFLFALGGGVGQKRVAITKGQRHRSLTHVHLHYVQYVRHLSACEIRCCTS